MMEKSDRFHLGDLPSGVIFHVILSNGSVLIQILSQTGYELEPWKATLGFDRYIFYPNPLKMVVHLVRERGVWTLFTGCVERLLSEFLFKFLDTTLANRLMKSDYGLLQDRLPVFWQHTLKLTLSRLVATVLCQPLRVLACRKVLQLVGGETVYFNPLSAVPEIYSHEGLLGFFSGLAPSMASVVMVTSLLAWAEKMSGPRSQVRLWKMKVNLWSLLLTYLTYPLSTVSTVMMASGSRLRAAEPYKSWVHCLAGLGLQRRLYRGAYLA